LPIIAGKGVKLELDASADGSTQQLKVKEQIAITLESNPSTGYAWHAKSSDPDIIDQVGDAQYNAPASTSTEPLIGAAGTETLYFSAASNGTATITLEYKRGWDTDVAPEKTLTIIVEIK
jgi:inhibitor of cysteine peptidase